MFVVVIADVRKQGFGFQSKRRAEFLLNCSYPTQNPLRSTVLVGPQDGLKGMKSLGFRILGR